MLTKTELSTWTKALRDNPKQQLNGRLINQEKTHFCCLGKLCETLGFKPTKANAAGDIGFLQETHFLPPEIIRKTGISCDGSTFNNINNNKKPIIVEITYKNLKYSSLAGANDSGVPWPVLADWLDNNYPAIEG